MNKSGWILVIAALPFAYLDASPSPAKAGELRGTLSGGFDSFTEKYTVVEDDTTDTLNEFRTRLILSYALGSILTRQIRVEGQAQTGEESTEAGGRLSLLGRAGAYRIGVVSEASVRGYRENTHYTFANDFVRMFGRAHLEREVAPGLGLRLTDRLELLDYERKTEFDNDFVRNTVELAAEIDWGGSHFGRATVEYSRRSVPDSSEIAYDGYGASVDYRAAIAPQRQITVFAAGERRVFDDEGTKSPYWALYSSVVLEPAAGHHFGIVAENVLDTYLYDTDSDAFFDYLENRSSIRVKYFRATDLTVSAGPTLGFLASGFSSEDEYTELGAKVTCDLSPGARLYVSGSYEPGFRNYHFEPALDAAAIYSDFTYHRILLLTTLRLTRHASLNVFAHHEPEDHEKEDDDATTTLFSADVSVSF